MLQTLGLASGWIRQELPFIMHALAQVHPIPGSSESSRHAICGVIDKD